MSYLLHFATGEAIEIKLLIKLRGCRAVAGIDVLVTVCNIFS